MLLLTTYRSRLLRTFTLLGFRLCNIGAKFLLALYAARYLGLADFGMYGLLVGATTAMPALLGFGVTAWIMRTIVGLPPDRAIPLMFTRLSLSTAAQVVLQIIAWAVNEALGEPIPPQRMLLIGFIIFFECIGSEVSSMLTARRRILLAETLLFLRAGLWPLPVIILGLYEPQARTLDVVLLGWAISLAVAFLIILLSLTHNARWRRIRFVWPELFQGIRQSVPLYTHDVCLAFNLYLDRYLISLFVSLELTGAYTFFWSFANVVNALAIYGVLTPQISRLVSAGSHESEEAFLDAERRVMIETGAWAILLSVILCASVPWVLAYIGRPVLTENLSIFWIVIVATLMRVGADAYGYALYALRCDKTIAWTSMAATASSACLNLLLIPYIGIRGAAYAFLLTATMQFGARLFLTRKQSALRLKHGRAPEVGAALSTVPTAGGR